MRVLLLTLMIALTNAKDNYRLPQSVVPENYKLDILTHLGPEENNFKFIGEVKIDVSTYVYILIFYLWATLITLHNTFTVTCIKFSNKFIVSRLSHCKVVILHVLIANT